MDWDLFERMTARVSPITPGPHVQHEAAISGKRGRVRKPHPRISEGEVEWPSYSTTTTGQPVLAKGDDQGDRKQARSGKH
jgi:hypothetical protein